MTSVFPTVPRVVFTILEPISLSDQRHVVNRIAGALAPVVDPQFFVSTQLAHVKPHNLLPTEHVLALQLGNVYLLLCMVGIAVLYTTSEARVVHGYILALWIADIGHLAATAYVMGSKPFMDISNWNATTMGNIGATTFLFAMRTLYMLGFLGQDRKPKPPSKLS